jgi:hypothetical protein
MPAQSRGLRGHFIGAFRRGNPTQFYWGTRAELQGKAAGFMQDAKCKKGFEHGFQIKI